MRDRSTGNYHIRLEYGTWICSDCIIYSALVGLFIVIGEDEIRFQIMSESEVRYFDVQRVAAVGGQVS